MIFGEISVTKSSLNLKMMLEGGQCFRWKEIAPFEWIGTISNVVWSIKQSDLSIKYQVLGGDLSKYIQSEDCMKRSVADDILKADKDLVEKKLKSYFRLDAPLEMFYEEWGKKDPNFKLISRKCYGIRILDQDPVENVFSFICSSNNNIKRISSLVEKLCKLYGPKLCEVDGVEYYGFPEISALARSQESDLRKAGFGYRAKFICESAKQLEALGGPEWLQKLRNTSYLDAKSQLIKLPGVGAKVADCICLMSLGHMEALPVDTHVYQIACHSYLPHLKKVKNLTDKIYNEIGDYFRDLYGPYAGWAHTVLFCGDLKAFKDSPCNLEKEKPTMAEKGDDSQGIAKRPRLKKKTESSSNEETYFVSGILKCSRRELNLRITLNSGQTYRFKELESDVWRGVFASKVWTLRQFDDFIEFAAHFKREVSDNINETESQRPSGEDETICKQLLYDYFRLDVNIGEHYKRWAQCDKHFNDVSEKFYGLRMIKQDIVENLFTFICSSCNTISRMTYMVQTMCSLYGEKIADIDGVIYLDFPTVDKLACKSVESDLLQYKFGYRAKYVQTAAKYIVEKGGNRWFHYLKSLSYEDAKAELVKLPGIAAKVADCICLTALDHLETIPVDTHVFQIAKCYYLPHLSSQKTISAQAYAEIGNCFRTIFGHYSGWAHTVLFAADLRQHKDLYL